MCFSLEADVAVALALTPVAILSLREVRTRSELPLAALPAVFAIHQAIEVLVWLGFTGAVSPAVQSAATFAYLAIALPLLPLLVPVALLLLHEDHERRRMVSFVALGAVVSGYLAWALATRPTAVQEHTYALEYQFGVQNGGYWAAAYVVAVIGPTLVSGERAIVAFGVANLFGLIVVGVLATQFFTSLWCVYAALVSVFVLINLRRRHGRRWRPRQADTPVTPLATETPGRATRAR